MAGTVTTAHELRAPVRALRFTIVADAADASVPDTELPKFSGRLLALETNPGATAPTANYDITIEDQHGHDVLEGVGGDRSAASTEKAAVVYTGTSIHPAVAADDTLTLKVANNLVNSAEITAVLYYEGAPVE